MQGMVHFMERYRSQPAQLAPSLQVSSDTDLPVCMRHGGSRHDAGTQPGQQLHPAVQEAGQATQTDLDAARHRVHVGLRAVCCSQPGLVIPEIPPQPEIPLPRWLMSVYLPDVMSHVEDVKAKLTSTFG